MSSLSHQFSHIKKITDHQDKRAIVFINADFSNCDTLIQRVVPELRVIVISPQADGVREITRIMHYSDCCELYIISEGFPGCMYIGNTELSLNTLIRYSAELESWFKPTFTNDNTDLDSPRLNLYGCDVAAGDVGEEFMTKLSPILGATIAASPKVPNKHIFN